VPDPEPWTLHTGDSLPWLLSLPAGAADAVVTDPPYSSGGMYRGDRANQSVAAKYVQTGTARFRSATFEGESRDQRGWAYWCHLWLTAARTVTRKGGYLLAFADWRQLPTLTDAVQAAGWTWRGVISWDKGDSARSANTSYFRHQAEFVVWGTNGTSDGYARRLGPWPGCYRHPVVQRDKHHPTGKPTALMRELVRCAPEGGLVVDPFAGSGTTGVGALLEGRRFAGCELDPDHAATARRRLADATGSNGLFRPSFTGPAPEVATCETLF
jgi:site-specific DNA-methyltransferase (adenine-specific)